MNTAKELDGVSTADVVGNDTKNNLVDSKLLSAVENKNALTKNLNKGKLMIDGKEVSKENFNKHYDKLQPKALQWNADKTRIIGGL